MADEFSYVQKWVGLPEASGGSEELYEWGVNSYEIWLCENRMQTQTRQK